MDDPLRSDKRLRRALLGGLSLLAAGCASLSEPVEEPGPLQADEPSLAGSAWALASQFSVATARGNWVHRRFGSQPVTRYLAAHHEGRPAVHAVSRAGNSALRQMLQPVDLPAGTQLRFSWWLAALNERADLRDSEIDDAVVRMILSFDGDRSKFSARDHLLSELAHALTGEPLPDATLMYVWDHRYPVGTVIDNPHTRRIRQLVVQSGPEDLRRWVDHERDVRADFASAFGEPMPRLKGVAVMSDSNNTGASVEAWFGPVRLEG